MKKYPESIANGLILNKQGEVLLVKDNRWNNLLTLPGGHVEVGENLKDTVKREIKDMLGIDVKVDDMINVQEFLMHPDYYTRKHFLLFNFSCHANGDSISLIHKEITHHIWARPKDALVMNLEPYSKQTIEDFIRTKNVEKNDKFEKTNGKSDVKIKI